MTLPSVPTRTALRAEVDAALTEVDERLETLESGGSGGGPHTHTHTQITDFTASVNTLVQAAVDALVAGAPGALDTLNELAAAIGDNENFAAAVTSSLAGKQPLHATLTALAALTLADGTVLARQSGAFTMLTFAALKAALALDHGELAGLGDDDHTQYYNQARGDARYARLTQLATVALSGSYPDLLNKPTIPATFADLSGTVPPSALPSLAVIDYLGAAANQAAMLALVGQKGDWTTRSDLGTVWIITGSDPTQLSSWQELSYPTAPVLSVSGKTGAVTLVKGDVGLSNVDNTSDASKPVSTATQAALDLKADASAAILKSLAAAKGDLIVATADDTVTVLPVGTNGQVPTADSTQATGIRWATPSGGGGGSPALKARTDTGMFVGAFGPCGIAGTWTVCPAAFRSLPIAAAVDDILDWRPSVILGVGTATSDAEFDLATIDNSSPGSPVILRCLSSATNTPLANGAGGMYCWQNNARRLPSVADWKVTSADLVGGTVTFALLYRANASGLAIGHASVYPSRVSVINYGPAAA